jgi:protein-S-isoprenylcysteine O-methyltransferase Ste14
MAAGGTAILAAQVGMGASWRIDLDRERSGLVTSGLFAVSRNPTFLGMVAVLLVAFLAAPTAATGMVLTTAWVAFSMQIRMEEEHLRRMHGPADHRYRAAVPRWIGLRGPSPEASAAHGRPVDHG